MLTDYGRSIRRKRDDFGVGITDMARTIGISTAELSSIEHGKKELSNEMAFKIVGYFDDLRMLVSGKHNDVPQQKTP